MTTQPKPEVLPWMEKAAGEIEYRYRTLAYVSIAAIIAAHAPKPEASVPVSKLQALADRWDRAAKAGPTESVWESELEGCADDLYRLIDSKRRMNK
ncbi:MAG: hypothetical protein ACYDB1_01095 [Acidiferrobacteraceae bacterium]